MFETLIHAVKLKQNDNSRLLLDVLLPARILWQDKDGLAVSHHVARHGLVECAEKIKEIWPALLEFSTDGGITPFILAVQHAQIPFVQYLLSEKISDFASPLHEWAFLPEANSRIEIIEINQKNCLKTDSQGYTPLDYAVFGGHADKFEQLRCHTPLDKINYSFLLRNAVSNHDNDMIKVLLDKMSAMILWEAINYFVADIDETDKDSLGIIWNILNSYENKINKQIFLCGKLIDAAVSYNKICLLSKLIKFYIVKTKISNVSLDFFAQMIVRAKTARNDLAIKCILKEAYLPYFEANINSNENSHNLNIITGLMCDFIRDNYSLSIDILLEIIDKKITESLLSDKVVLEKLSALLIQYDDLPAYMILSFHDVNFINYMNKLTLTADKNCFLSLVAGATERKAQERKKYRQLHLYGIIFTRLLRKFSESHELTADAANEIFPSINKAVQNIKLSKLNLSLEGMNDCVNQIWQLLEVKPFYKIYNIDDWLKKVSESAQTAAQDMTASSLGLSHYMYTAKAAFYFGNFSDCIKALDYTLQDYVKKNFYLAPSCKLKLFLSKIALIFYEKLDVKPKSSPEAKASLRELIFYLLSKDQDKLFAVNLLFLMDFPALTLENCGKIQAGISALKMFDIGLIYDLANSEINSQTESNARKIAFSIQLLFKWIWVLEKQLFAPIVLQEEEIIAFEQFQKYPDIFQIFKKFCLIKYELLTLLDKILLKVYGAQKNYLSSENHYISFFRNCFLADNLAITENTLNVFSDFSMRLFILEEQAHFLLTSCKPVSKRYAHKKNNTKNNTKNTNKNKYKNASKREALPQKIYSAGLPTFYKENENENFMPWKKAGGKTQSERSGRAFNSHAKDKNISADVSEKKDSYYKPAENQSARSQLPHNVSHTESALALNQESLLELMPPAWLKKYGLMIDLPPQVIKFMSCFKESEIFLTGGAVRDKLLNFEVNDYDFVVLLSLETLKSKFPALKVQGQGKFQSYKIDCEQLEFDVALCRDIDARNGRDFNQSFQKPLQNDSKFRDFTCNAFYYHPEIGLLDFYGGLKHLLWDKQICLIRSLDKNKYILADNPLWLLKLAKLYEKFNFSMPDALKDAVKSNTMYLYVINHRRLEKEFECFIKLFGRRKTHEILKKYNLIEVLKIRGIISNEPFQTLSDRKNAKSLFFQVYSDAHPVDCANQDKYQQHLKK